MLQQGIPGGPQQELDAQYGQVYGGGYGNMMYGGGNMGNYGNYGGGMGYGPMMPGGYAEERPAGMATPRAGGYGGGVARPTGAVGGPPRQRMDQEFVEGKLFLGGLDNATTKETLLEYCQQWGEVTDYVLMEGRGFGFVTFRDASHAQQFLEQREHVIDSKKVEAKAAVPKNSGSSSTLTRKMFVGGTGEITDEEFRTYFQQFGEIEDCVVLRKPDGGSRGFGFVTFKDEMSVEKCLVMQHVLNNKQVEIKRAVKKEDMNGPPAAGGGVFVGGAGGPMRTGKAPDWICPDNNCRNKNFGWREECNRCHIPRPKNGGPTPMGVGGPMRAAGGYEGGMGMAQMGGQMAPMGGMAPMGQMGGMGMGMGYGAMGYGNGMAPYGGMGPAAYGAGAMGSGYAAGYGAAPSGQGYGRAAAGRGASRYRPY